MQNEYKSSEKVKHIDQNLLQRGLVLIARLESWFHYYLLESSLPAARKARIALFDQGLNLNDIRMLRIGFSPAGTLLENPIELSNSAFPLLWIMGLLRAVGSETHEHLANKIVFPFTDASDVTRGFSGLFLESEYLCNGSLIQTPWLDPRNSCFGLVAAKKLTLETGSLRIVKSELLAASLQNNGIAAISVPATEPSPALKSYLHKLAWRITFDS